MSSSRAPLLLFAGIVISCVTCPGSAFRCGPFSMCECSPETAQNSPKDVLGMRCKNVPMSVLPPLTPYTALELLDIQDSPIVTLDPSALSTQTNLLYLHLYRGDMTAFPFAALNQLTKLQGLTLEDMKWVEPFVPEEFFRNRTSLAGFSIHGPGVSPATEGSSALTGLNVTMSHLRHLPKLELLDISGNPLSCQALRDSGTSFGQTFNSLAQLGVDDCGFGTVPEFVSSVTQLNLLNIRGNGITSLTPGQIPSTVVRLVLERNNITVLRPEPLPRNLELLRLDDNLVSELVPGDYSPKLTTFGLKNNRITMLSSRVFPDNTTIVALAGNAIRVVDFGVLNHLTRLEGLSISGATDFLTTCFNTFEKTAACLCGDHLVRSADGTACTVCPENPPGFPDIDCPSGIPGARCNVTCGAFLRSRHPAEGNDRPQAATGATSDSMVMECTETGKWTIVDDGTNNAASALLACDNIICDSDVSPCQCTFGDNNEATSVSCDHAGLTRIPGGLPASLKALSLRNNSIWSAPEDAINHIKDLEEADLAHNVISYLPTGLFQHSSLRVINLSHNVIYGIDTFPFPASFNIMSLDLSHNDITFISDPRVFGMTLSDPRPYGRPDGYDMGVLNMAGNDVDCRLNVRRFPFRTTSHIECSCDRLDSDVVPFCPKEPSIYRFPCAIGDSVDDVATYKVCDGASQCLPSGIDEDPEMCGEALMTMWRASTSNCRALTSSRPLIDKCADSDQDDTCFAVVRLSVSSGIVNLTSENDCGAEFCSSAVGLLTDIGRSELSGDGYVARLSKGELGVVTRLQLGQDDDGVDIHRGFPCSFSFNVSLGKPLGLSSFTESSGDAGQRSIGTATGPSASASTTPGPQQPTSPSGPADSQDTGMTLSAQRTVVGVFCTALAIILISVAGLLLWLRTREMSRSTALFLSTTHGPGGQVTKA